MTAKLRHKGFAKEEIAQLLDDLVERGFLSEPRAAELFFLRAQGDKSYGLRYWHRKMIERGFPEELVHEVLGRIRADRDEKEAASDLAASLMRSGKSAEQVARSLASRGFATDAIIEALRKLRLDICEPGS